MKWLTLLLVILTSGALLSCNKDKTSETDTLLAGNWISTMAMPSTTTNARYQTELQFYIDGVYISKAFLISPTDQRLGYSGKTVGRYRVNVSGVLEIYEAKFYMPPAGSDLAEESALVFKTNQPNEIFDYQINPQNTLLTWTVRCPMNANCIGKQLFVRISKPER
jgi:hypothetical protein